LKIIKTREVKDTYANNQKEVRNTHINIGTGKDASKLNKLGWIHCVELKEE
jgi:hypothetical protein